MRVEGPLERAERWNLEYLEGTLLRQGMHPLYASKTQYNIPEKLFLYYIDAANRLKKSVVNKNEICDVEKHHFTDEPVPPVYKPGAMISGYLKGLVLVGLPLYVAFQRISISVSVPAILQGIALIGQKITADEMYQKDKIAWQEYRKFMEEAGRGTSYKTLD